MNLTDRTSPDVFAVYESLPAGTIGYDVRDASHSLLWRPNTDAVAAHLEDFLTKAGLRCQRAVAIPLGAAAGGPGTMWETFFQFMKPIGLTIQIVKFLFAWHARVAAFKRRLEMPRVVIMILAEHIQPQRQTAAISWDTATLFAVLLPELQKNLEDEFPSFAARHSSSPFSEETKELAPFGASALWLRLPGAGNGYW